MYLYLLSICIFSDKFHIAVCAYGTSLTASTHQGTTLPIRSLPYGLSNYGLITLLQTKTKKLCICIFSDKVPHCCVHMVPH